MSKTVLISSDRFETPRTQAIDAFMTGGYRKMLVRLLEGTLVDMLGSNEANRNAAKNWFDPVMGCDAAITFEDCVIALGIASMTEEIRQMAIEDPAELLTRLKDFHGGDARVGRHHGAKESAEADAPGEIPGLRVDAFGLEGIHRAMFSGA